MKPKLFTFFQSTLTLFLIVVFSLPGFAQLNADHHDSREIIPDQIRESEIIQGRRVESATGIARAIYKPAFTATKAQPSVMAMQYIQSNASELLKKADANDLKFERSIETPGGFKVQYVQEAAGYPVYNADVRVSINRNNEVVFVTNSYQPILNLQNRINVTEETALQTAKTHLGYSGKTILEKSTTIVYPKDLDNAVVAYKINVVPAESDFGDWEFIVDAATGEVLRAENKACTHHPDGHGVKGSGWVYDPDPVSNASRVYGVSGFVDGNDSPSDSLDAQLKEVELLDITFEDGLYKLIGPNAEIIDVESPFTGTFEQDSSNFHFNRDNRAFEATLIYYHVDKSMRYLNDSLGFNVWPFQYEGGVRFDPHGFDNAVNAHYVGSSGHIAFGSPGGAVDLGEDHAVVLHELGHGIHDWITNGGLSQVNGLSEGLSDYWAQSYTRSLGKYAPEDNGYNWFGVWGGQPNWGGPSLRRTDVAAHYPEDLVGQVHTDGQMWSSSLMSIYDEIGKEATDVNMWEGISMLNSQSSQQDAAMAFIQADRDLYGGVHMDVIYEVFFERGYIEDPIAVSFTTDQNAGPGPLTVNFSDNSTSFFGEINEWEWDLDGDGEIDSHEQNPSFTYEEPGAYTVSLKVSDGSNTNAVVQANYIVVIGGFLVYEGGENLRDHSATFIKEFLENRGHEVVYTNFFPSTLDGFEGVFLTYGNLSTDFTAMSEAMVTSMIDYLKSGGKLYLEPGVNFRFGQGANPELLELLGISGVTSSGVNSINELTGQEGSLAEGLTFTSSTQIGNRFIDRYQPIADDQAKIAFVESGYGDVAIQFAGDTYGQKSFSFGYALSELVDVDPQSSQYHLMVRIMEHFGYPEVDNYVVANFDMAVSAVLPGEEVQFEDWSFSAPATSIIEWAWDLDMDGTIDSYDQNPTHSYNAGGVYDIMLIASNGEVSDTLIKRDALAVKSGILVYDGKSGINGYSGAFIRDYLEANFYDEVGYTNNLPTDLEGYDVVFISLGNAGNRSTSLTGAQQVGLENYGQDGGKIYMEGGDAMSEAEYLWLIFGIIDVENGSNNQINGLVGQDGSFTQGLEFSGSTQFTNNNIDVLLKINDVPEIQTGFEESEYGPVAVEFDGTQLFGQKTFSMSYAIAELEDGEGNSTREELLARILNFFDVVASVDNKLEASAQQLFIYPNPGKDQVTLRLDADRTEAVELKLYDMSGRIITVQNHQLQKGTQQLNVNTSGLPVGVYYFNVASEKRNETVKWLKID